MVDPSKLHAALLKTKIVMAKWLERALSEIENDFWHKCVLPKVSYGQKLNIDKRKCSKLSQLDLAVLLRVFDKNWDDISYKCNLDIKIRHYLHEVQDIRNNYAHLSDYPPPEDFLRDVDTLYRFLRGIGIDDAFCAEVKAIGKEPELMPEATPGERLEPDDVSSTEAFESENNRPLELGKPVSLVSPPPTSKNVEGIKEVNSMEMQDNPAEVLLLEKSPFCPGATHVKAKMRNNGVSGFTFVNEITGEKARELYVSMKGKSGVPNMSGISFAVIAKRDEGEDTPLQDAKTTLDAVLAEDIEEFTPCVVQEVPEACLIWFFGKEKKDVLADGTTLPVLPVPEGAKFFSVALPDWWSKMAKEPRFEALKPLSIEEVQKTIKLSEHDLWRYMKTYAPRSYAEAFYLSKMLPQDMLSRIWESKSGMDILDVGCGVGGAAMGGIDAIATRKNDGSPVRLVGLDGNENALMLMSGFLSARSKDAFSYIDSARDVAFTAVNRTFAEEVAAPMREQFDIIIASKSLGEERGLSFSMFFEYVKTHLKDDGAVLLVELLKHEQSVRAAATQSGLPADSLFKLSVRIGVSGRDMADNEEVVVCLARRNMFK